MEKLGISAKLARFFWLIFILNLLFSVMGQIRKPEPELSIMLLHLFFPVWVPLVVAFPFGLIFSFAPFRDFGFEKRLFRAVILTAMWFSFGLFILYLYDMLTMATLMK